MNLTMAVHDWTMIEMVSTMVGTKARIQFLMVTTVAVPTIVKFIIHDDCYCCCFIAKQPNGGCLLCRPKIQLLIDHRDETSSQFRWTKDEPNMDGTIDIAIVMILYTYDVGVHINIPWYSYDSTTCCVCVWSGLSVWSSMMKPFFPRWPGNNIVGQSHKFVLLLGMGPYQVPDINTTYVNSQGNQASGCIINPNTSTYRQNRRYHNKYHSRWQPYAQWEPQRSSKHHQMEVPMECRCSPATVALIFLVWQPPLLWNTRGSSGNAQVLFGLAGLPSLPLPLFSYAFATPGVPDASLTTAPPVTLEPVWLVVKMGLPWLINQWISMAIVEKWLYEGIIINTNEHKWTSDCYCRIVLTGYIKIHKVHHDHIITSQYGFG